MNRTVIASVLLTGAIGTGILTLLPEARTIDTSALRLAIADRPCPAEGEPGYVYLKAHCMHHKTVDRGDGYCLCTTTESEPLTGEMTVEELPDSVCRSYMSCRFKDSESEDPDQWRTAHRWVRLNATAPDNWTNVSCQTIVPRAFRLAVRANLKTPLVERLQDECGPWVTPTHWRCCPDCLHYPAGCPPCVGLCKYGKDWVGHEDECQAEGTL